VTLVDQKDYFEASALSFFFENFPPTLCAHTSTC
jgi:hypothetical protein